MKTLQAQNHCNTNNPPQARNTGNAVLPPIVEFPLDTNPQMQSQQTQMPNTAHIPIRYPSLTANDKRQKRERR